MNRGHCKSLWNCCLPLGRGPLPACRRRGLAAALWVLSAVWAEAAPQQVRIIDFEEALDLALRQNNSLHRAETAAALGEVAVSDARNQLVPDLRFSTSGGQNYGRSFSETEGRVIDEASRSLNAGLSSGVTVFDGLRNIASLKGAKLSHEASQHNLARARETVVFTVASNFLALIREREQLRVQRQNLAAQEALARQINSYVEAGARTVADLYQQQATVANVRLTLVQQQRAVELAKVDLIQTLQLDPRGTYEFVAPPAESISASGQRARAQEVNLDALLARALAQRTDLAAGRAQVAAAEQNARAARAGRWPTLSLGAGYSSGYTSASPLSFHDQLDLRRGGSLNLTVSVPLFDRHATRNATRRAELQALTARIELEDAEQAVGLQVRRAYLDYRAAREQLAAAEAQQRAAGLALEAAEERYQAGASTLVELSQARATHVQAESAWVTARYNLLFQRTLMDYYLGALDPTALP